MRGAALAVGEAVAEPCEGEVRASVVEGAEDASASGKSTDASTAPTEADALEELADEIARLAAHLHAAKGRLLALVAEFDRRRGWKPGGHRNCTHWLAFRAGFDLRTARDHVRVARSLETLPALREAMARGRLSYSQVRALTRVATPETEVDLLALADGVPTPKLERMVRAWKKGSRQDEAARERARHRTRWAWWLSGRWRPASGTRTPR